MSKMDAIEPYEALVKDIFDLAAKLFFFNEHPKTTDAMIEVALVRHGFSHESAMEIVRHARQTERIWRNA